jgi:hypothetical protein
LHAQSIVYGKVGRNKEGWGDPKTDSLAQQQQVTLRRILEVQMKILEYTISNTTWIMTAAPKIIAKRKFYESSKRCIPRRAAFMDMGRLYIPQQMIIARGVHVKL